MKIFARLLAFFLVMPIVELFLLLQVTRWFDEMTDGRGILITLAIIAVTGIAGSFLAKREGLSVWRRLNARLGEGGLPSKELTDGVIILVAGALLITPGVLTDLFGFVGLIPLTRRPLRSYLLDRFRKAATNHVSASFGAFGSFEYEGGSTIPSENEPDDVPPAWEGDPADRPAHNRDDEHSETAPDESDRLP